MIEGLPYYEGIVDQLEVNTNYDIQTHAVYRMTPYNGNEQLALYSSIVTQRTEGELCHWIIVH